MKTNARLLASSLGLLLTTGLAGLLVSGCSDGSSAEGSLDSADPRETGSHSDQLYMDGTTLKWPNGIVPVCWDATSAARSDFAQRSREVRDAANNSWPTVANVEFTGWQTCGTSYAGMVRIVLKDSGGSNAGGIGYSPSGRTMSLNVNSGNWTNNSLIPHEFGHTLGFRHEFVHPNNDDPTCPLQNGETIPSTGDDLNTPFDGQSIMASTGYCQTNAQLSRWDIVGAINAYGPRVNFVSPLVTGWNSTAKDHATVATPGSISNVDGGGYSWAYAEGWVFNQQFPGTVPLKLYWNPTRKDNFTLADATSQSDAVAAGYTYAGTEGYVFSSSQPGTVALKLYWNNTRLDHMLVTAGASENAAVGAGYTYVRTEGYIPQATPYALGWSYWHQTRGDNLITAQYSTLASNAGAAGYQFVGFDGAFWKHQFPGTTAIKNYYNSTREDHFALANSTSQTDAVSAGYTLVGTEGYVYSSSTTGASSANSYWRADRGDHFTTIGQQSVAVSQGYSTVRTEGYGLPINP